MGIETERKQCAGAVDAHQLPTTTTTIAPSATETTLREDTAAAKESPRRSSTALSPEEHLFAPCQPLPVVARNSSTQETAPK